MIYSNNAAHKPLRNFLTFLTYYIYESQGILFCFPMKTIRQERPHFRHSKGKMEAQTGEQRVRP